MRLILGSSPDGRAVSCERRIIGRRRRSNGPAPAPVQDGDGGAAGSKLLMVADVRTDGTATDKSKTV